ncbi:MAG TPA: FkbM family methyltransferase [Pyrinomonadaceae bacterium]|jgi:FkbM family methyltransferase
MNLKPIKNTLKRMLESPFLLLNKVNGNKESFWWKSSYDALSDNEKLRMSKKALFSLLTRKGTEKGFKIISYLNALNCDSLLASNFVDNFIENLPLYESQLGQDCIVDTIFNKKQAGVFVEIGVGDGKRISNTYFLEKHRNWTGVLCEPSKKFHDSILQKRNAVLVTDAIYNKSNLEIEFSEVVGNEELSTLSDHKLSDSHNRTDVKNYAVKTISFNDLYEKQIKNKKIDYLSVDTEGSELTILSAIDFNRIDISVISVEHNYNKDKLDEISSLLSPFGYVEILPDVFEFDAIFVKREIYES